MKNILSVVLLLVSFTVYGQSNVDVVSFETFSGLRVSGNIVVELSKGTENSAKIEMVYGERNALSTIVSEDGILKIRFNSKRKMSMTKNKAKVYLTYNQLNLIKATNGASIKNIGTLEVADLELVSSAGAYMELRVKVENLMAKVNAGSKLTLEGDAHNQNAKCTSGSNYDASKLYSNNVKAKALSGANMKLWCSESIDARANSGGNISYTGNPAIKDIKNISGGVVQKL